MGSRQVHGGLQSKQACFRFDEYRLQIHIFFLFLSSFCLSLKTRHFQSSSEATQKLIPKMTYYPDLVGPVQNHKGMAGATPELYNQIHVYSRARMDRKYSATYTVNLCIVHCSLRPLYIYGVNPASQLFPLKPDLPLSSLIGALGLESKHVQPYTGFSH